MNNGPRPSDAEISEKAVPHYGLAYHHQKEQWDEVRNHPLFVLMVKRSMGDITRQLEGRSHEMGMNPDAAQSLR